MDLCAVLINRYKANVTQVRGHFALVAEAMGFDICDAGECSSGNKVLYNEEVISLKHLRQF